MPDFRTARIPRVVGGADAEALRLARALYGAGGGADVPVSSLEAAEAVKLTENVFRAVNIALVNELKLVFERHGHRYLGGGGGGRQQALRLHALLAGPGGGRPLHPGRSASTSPGRPRAAGVPARFIELAGEINADMPFHVVTALEAALRARWAGGCAGSRILVLGAAYKPGIEDVRESPALRLIELIEAQGGTAPLPRPAGAGAARPAGARRAGRAAIAALGRGAGLRCRADRHRP